MAESRRQRAANAVVRTLLESPLHRLVDGKLMMMHVVGRKSGRVYDIPIAYTREPDGHLLVGTPQSWRKNLSSGDVVELDVKSRRVQAPVEVVTDPQRCAEYYRTILKHNAVHGKFVGVSLDADGSVNTDELGAALDAGLAVLRFDAAAVPA